MRDLIMVSLATPGKYRAMQNRLVQATVDGGAITMHDAWDAEHFFYTPSMVLALEANPTIFSSPVGLGFYAWKPFLILYTMLNHPNHDVLYMDVDEWIDPSWAKEHAAKVKEALALRPVVAFSFDFGYRQIEWTTRDCFAGMGCDTPQFHQLPHLHAGQLAFRNDAQGQRIVRHWRSLCLREKLIGAGLCQLPNYPEFREHRWDQSILTNLLELEGIKATDGLEQFRRYSKE